MSTNGVVEAKQKDQRQVAIVVDLTTTQGTTPDRRAEFQERAWASLMDKTQKSASEQRAVKVTPASEIGDIAANRTLSTDERIKAFEQVRKDYALSDYQMRQLIGAAYNKLSSSLLSGNHRPDSINALSQELDCVEKKYRSAFGFDEIKEYRSALNKKEKQVLEAAALEQKKAREGVVREGENHASEVLLSKDLSPADKIERLARIQKSLNLKGQEMRELIGRVLKDHQSAIVGQIQDKEGTLRVKEEMALLDKHFGRAGTLWENDQLQREVDAKLKGYEKAERQAAAVEAERAKEAQAAQMANEARAREERLVSCEQEILGVLKDPNLKHANVFNKLDAIRDQMIKDGIIKDAAAFKDVLNCIYTNHKDAFWDGLKTSSDFHRMEKLTNAIVNRYGFGIGSEPRWMAHHLRQAEKKAR